MVITENNQKLTTSFYQIVGAVNYLNNTFKEVYVSTKLQAFSLQL